MKVIKTNQYRPSVQSTKPDQLKGSENPRGSALESEEKQETSFRFIPPTGGNKSKGRSRKSKRKGLYHFRNNKPLNPKGKTTRSNEGNLLKRKGR